MTEPDITNFYRIVFIAILYKFLKKGLAVNITFLGLDKDVTETWKKV